MIQSKTEDFDQMKNLITNLTSMIAIFTNGHYKENNENKAPQYISKSPSNAIIRQNSENNRRRRRSRNSSKCDPMVFDKNRKSNKLINFENNSSYSICSEFSIENCKDIVLQVSSDPSLKTNRNLQVIYFNLGGRKNN